MLILDIERQSDSLVEFCHQNRLLNLVVIVEVDPTDRIAERAWYDCQSVLQLESFGPEMKLTYRPGHSYTSH